MCTKWYAELSWLHWQDGKLLPPTPFPARLFGVHEELPRFTFSLILAMQGFSCRGLGVERSQLLDQPSQRTTLKIVPPWGAPHGILGGPWPTQKFRWVGHNAFGPPKKCRCKIKYSYCFQCLRNFFCQLPFVWIPLTD
jgi:hypothetical protein